MHVKSGSLELAAPQHTSHSTPAHRRKDLVPNAVVKSGIPAPAAGCRPITAFRVESASIQYGRLHRVLRNYLHHPLAAQTLRERLNTSDDATKHLMRVGFKSSEGSGGYGGSREAGASDTSSTGTVEMTEMDRAYAESSSVTAAAGTTALNPRERNAKTNRNLILIKAGPHPTIKLASKNRKRHTHFKLEDLNKVEIYNVPFTEQGLRKFVQVQLLVSCFYVAIFLCTYVYMFKNKVEGLIFTSSMWCVLSLGSLLFNILVVMPIMMFLGFR